MKVLLLSLLACSLMASQTFAQPSAAPRQSPDAAEVERLSREVNELYQAGKLKEALPLAERAVVMTEAVSPTDERATAMTYSNLAAIHAGMEKFGRARAAYERALPMLERSFGSDHEATNQVRESLASALFREGSQAQAEQMLKLALASRERTLGPQHEATMRSLASLAFFYLASGQSEKRDAAYNRLLDAAEKSPNELPGEVRAVLSRYALGGSSDSDASTGRKAIYKRIYELWAPVSGGELNGKAISKPAPAYPVVAKAARAQGTVVIQITVDEDGRVIDAKPISGPRQLHDASVRAALQARFEPTLKDGQPAKVTGTITYNFVLR